jgi:hypothetical protein
VLPDVRSQEVIETALRQFGLDLHTGFPGKIVSYLEATQRASVQPCIKRALDADDGSLAYEALPTIPNVLVGWPYGGGMGLRFALAAGDSVWCICSETDSGAWEKTGNPANPAHVGRHTLNSLIAIPISRAPMGPLYGNVITEGGPFVVGLTALAAFVARADLVDAQLAALKAAIAAAAVTETTALGLGGTAALAANLSAWPLPVAAAKLKAE